jgi:hypothetical protein
LDHAGENNMPMSDEELQRHIDNLQQQLDELEMEQKRQEQEITDIDLKILSIKKRAFTQLQAKNGYVICLYFGAGILSCEWLEEAHSWRIRGLGTRYPSLEEAEERFAVLKAKWPNYPLKIIN